MHFFFKFGTREITIKSTIEAIGGGGGAIRNAVAAYKIFKILKPCPVVVLLISVKKLYVTC